MATREIIEIPDSKSGDINELRDKKIALAKDAAAQSDLPQQLEYLIKNGQTGEFMNVLDSYINEKIRVALGNLAYSYAKESTMARVLGIDANKDLGSASLSSLASLLGVLHINDDIPSAYNNDLDLIDKTSMYPTNGAAKHRPVNDWITGLVLTIICFTHPTNNTKYGFQFWYNTGATPNKFYVRYYVSTANRQWYEIPITSV